MQVLPLFSTILFAQLPSANPTKWFSGSEFWSKLINFDLSIIIYLVALQSTSKFLLSKKIYPKAKK